MGRLLNLIEMLGNVVSRGQGDSKIYDWMLAITNTIESGAASTATFGSIATPSTSRLVDAPLTQIALLRAGDAVFVTTVKDFFRWDPLSTLTADNITVINPTSNGANPGRFVRELIPAPEWMLQATWFVDSMNGSDENDATTIGTSLKTDAERQRRMGPTPLWNGGEYHIRYLNDMPATDPVRIMGTRARNSVIFLHGSATNGQGQAILFSGAITALTVLDNSTSGATHSWQLTAGSIPVSWTASNLVNRRIRMTSGASLGAKSFAIKDLGTKQARCDEFLVKNTYTFPFNFQRNTKAPPTNGDTFVVEQLTSIVAFFWHVEDVDDGGLNTTFIQGCIESLALGVDSVGNVLGDFNVINGGDDFLCFDSCMCVWFGAGSGGTLFFGSTGIYGQLQPGAWQNALLSGGHYSGIGGNLGLSAKALFLELQNNFIFQFTGVGPQVLRIQCFCQLFDVGMFDNPTPIRIQGTRVEFRGKLWGSGNLSFIANFDPGAVAFFDANAQFNLSVATVPEFGFLFAGTIRTAIPAFDTATNTYTADRTTTLAHLTATIAAGGFNNSMSDPVSGGALVKT